MHRILRVLDSSRASRLLRECHPATLSLKVSDEKSPKGIEAVASETAFDVQYCRAPAQPGDKSRVRGDNSIARLPAFGGKDSETAYQPPRYRTPQCVKKEKRAQSGFPPATSDYDASSTAPVVQEAETVSGSKKSASPVEVNSAASGKLRKSRFAERPVDPDATEASELNATGSSASPAL